MATITKPMALDESFNTTETTPRSQADVLAAIESAIRQGFGRSAADVSYDNTTSGLTADDVQEAIDELAEEKVDKVAGKGLSTNDFTDEDKEALDNMELDIASTQTISGNPLTITDAAPINAESLVVELEPNQDLHGQSAPYVGGAGKNKLPLTVEGIKAANTDGTWTGNAYALNGVTFTINTDADGNVTNLKVNGTASATIFFKLCDFPACLTDGASYKINGNASGYGSSTAYMQVQTSNGGGVANVGEEYTLAYTSGGTAQRLIIRIDTNESASNLIFYPMIRLSTETDPTFAPYSNICPISGYTECDLDDVGKNWFGSELEEGAINSDDGQPIYVSDRYRTKNYISVLPSTHYIFGINGIGQRENWYEYDKDYNYIGRVGYENNFTTSAQTRYVKCYGTNELINNTTIQLEKGTQATTYEPYHSSNATIQFGQTVYGGSVDFLTGVVTVDRALEVFDGSNDEGWFGRNNDRSRSTSKLQGIIKNASSDGVAVDFIKSNMFKKGSADEGWGGNPNIIGVGTDGIIYTSTGETMSISDWTTYLVNNNLQICYELATPFTLQLTPQELKLLQGTNNITTNGTTINLGYQPDNVIGEVKGEIEKCAVDAEFMQFTDGTDTFTDVNLSLDAFFHTVSVVGSKIEQKRFICFEVMDKMGGALQGILASCIAFTDGAKTPSGTAFRAYIESLQMYVNFRIYGSGGSYTLAYQSESSFSASAFFVRVRMMNNL